MTGYLFVGGPWDGQTRELNGDPWQIVVPELDEPARWVDTREPAAPITFRHHVYERAAWDTGTGCVEIRYRHVGTNDNRIPENPMNPETVPRPEANVIADIDALVDEQLAAGEHWAHADPCPVCGGMWHGLRGDGGGDINVIGAPGAEAYPQIGNGGMVGCPGGHAISAARIVWRYRLVAPAGWYKKHQPTPRNPYTDQITGVRFQAPWVRFWDADYNEIPPDASIPRPADGPLEDVVLAFQRFTDSARQLAGRFEQLPIPRSYRCQQCQRHLEPNQALAGFPPGSVWCQECADMRTRAYQHFRQRALQGLDPPQDQSGIAGPTGRLMDGVFDADGNLINLEAAGFHDIGQLEDYPNVAYWDENANPVTYEQVPPTAPDFGSAFAETVHPGWCDENHCYCDSPYRCQWNRSVGPQPPVRTTPHGEATHMRRARAARRAATRRRQPAHGGPTPPPTLAGTTYSYTDAHGVTFTETYEGHGQGWTLADIMELRAQQWRDRGVTDINVHPTPPVDAQHPPTRCPQVGDVLTVELGNWTQAYRITAVAQQGDGPDYLVTAEPELANTPRHPLLGMLNWLQHVDEDAIIPPCPPGHGPTTD